MFFVFAMSREDLSAFFLKHPVDSINYFILFLPKSAYTENKFDSSGQKRATMAKRYTLIHAHEKNLA